ncbi:MAG: hypothetical protein HC838_12800 [Spirulinaceae cyanobacterium RM2_2_10]|nr:hypothetical protein [Spirulinaceae cyanobacterium SM2_1_0]NJO20735.1 hypothetical protein [Spirulinaceae cyanobacterium RM2_2_10]
MAIHEIVQQALQAGMLSIEAERQLRQRLQSTRYGLDDVRAFAVLQQAMMSGRVQQQSRQLLTVTPTSTAA